jgi:hypothetical protein
MTEHYSPNPHFKQCVFVLIECPEYQDINILGVFSTREQAENKLKSYCQYLDGVFDDTQWKRVFKELEQNDQYIIEESEKISKVTFVLEKKILE